MKKPTAVKIVEVLGWMEVVLVLYGVIWAVNAIVHGKCGSASDVWICMGISLVVLALPVGMVMSLRHGRRAGFIWPHSGVALFAVFAFSMVLEMWCAAAIALILLVAVLFLLSRPEATHWFNEMSNGKMLDNYGCAAIFLTGLMYLLAAPAFVGMLSELLTDGGMHGDMNLRMWDILSAMDENNRQREAGNTWVDPSSYTNSTDFLQALCAGSGFHSGSLRRSLGAYTNVWCIVVNPSDKSDFPILFTANLAPSDLFGVGGRRVSLTCPKEWGGECFGYCEKKAIVVRSGRPERMQVLKPKNIHAISLSEESRSELADTYVLTPTGRVAIVDKAASLEGPKFLGPREPLPGAKPLELPIAEHGDELADESSADDRIFLEIHLADAAGEMRPEPMVVVEGRTFTLRRDDSSWPHQGKWLWHRLCEAVRASNAADPHQDGPLCFIKADSRCTFRNVSDVFDLCSSAGAWKLSVVARRGDDDTKSVYFKLRRPCPCHAPEEDAHLFYDCPYDEDDESDGECDDQQSLGRLLTIEVGPRFEGESEGAILRLRRRTSLAELDSAFGEMAKDPAIAGKSVCMKCTENSPYSTFVKIMDILYKHGFKRVYVFTL